MTHVLARIPEDSGQIVQITMGGICELLILL